MTMNPFDLICWGSLAMGLGLPFLYMLSIIMAQVERARADAERTRERKRAIELREAEAARRAELQEARIARANNDVVLQDARLELTNLRILKEKKAQGLTAQPFTPDEFQPKE